ncbi:hypothetical protein J7T55_003327 [Diaporthe amygdali]|uniref:uncharacterized protein n=1 Tax=Phomopsis amygdali TaxID=1214568 RepID=UPI0022FF27B8|nr:uncharacterized protein J7T55_003327 [Diaporthe amygdali]KAJ0116913.1 hypothetical protein J7T55_003327 [Diaporthe amygdali]
MISMRCMRHDESDSALPRRYQGARFVREEDKEGSSSSQQPSAISHRSSASYSTSCKQQATSYKKQAANGSEVLLPFRAWWVIAEGRTTGDFQDKPITIDASHGLEAHLDEIPGYKLRYFSPTVVPRSIWVGSLQLADEMLQQVSLAAGGLLLVSSSSSSSTKGAAAQAS